MAYFSSCSEGMDYEEQFCAKCIHGDGDGAGQCAVIAAHFARNYQECKNKDSILHMLIPRSADGLSNEQCLMFVERRTNARSDLRELPDSPSR